VTIAKRPRNARRRRGSLYFTGADELFEKLKRALKAEIDEAAWSSLYSTKSRTFPMPASKKIAVKVINHYGDEVLKVIGV
jgi:adenine-specific DNA-methyltransferase